METDKMDGSTGQHMISEVAWLMYVRFAAHLQTMAEATRQNKNKSDQSNLFRFRSDRFRRDTRCCIITIFTIMFH
jgi:hypothetical protein